MKDNHFAVNVTDVVGISCPNIPGSLAKVLRCLSDEGVFIEYMYSFANGQTANVIIRPNDMENCIRVLTEKKVDLLAARPLCSSLPEVLMWISMRCAQGGKRLHTAMENSLN